MQAYSSNTIDKPRNAFLDIKGKIVVVFDQAFLSEDEILIVIERQFLGRLKSHLEKYLFLTGTTLIPTSHLVYYDLDGDLQLKEGELAIQEKQGRLVLMDRRLLSNVTDEEFTLFRLKNDLPVQGIDYDEEMLLNIGNEEFVSFTKGCYLGQEIIARVHHRSKPAKKLVTRPVSECGREEIDRMTSKTFDPDSKKELGFIFVVR